jgi:large subunit ribosomal protein L21
MEKTTEQPIGNHGIYALNNACQEPAGSLSKEKHGTSLAIPPSKNIFPAPLTFLKTISRRDSMRAVIATGGKQYIVQEKDVIEVEKLAGNPGDKVTIEEVLLVGEGSEVECGTPTVPNAKVEAKIVDQFKGDKVVAFKMKRRKSYRRKKGHRQELTKIEITKISVGKASNSKQEKAEAKTENAEKATAKKSPSKKAEEKAAKS